MECDVLGDFCGCWSALVVGTPRGFGGEPIFEGVADAACNAVPEREAQIDNSSVMGWHKQLDHPWPQDLCQNLAHTHKALEGQ